MAESLPLFTQTIKFKATGTANVFAADIPLPMHRIPTVWAMQVTGLAADGKTIAAPSAWEVVLQGSLDLIGYDDDSAAAMLNHKGGVNPNGAVVKSNANFMPMRAVQIHCKTLTLGPADCILVTVVGC